MWERPQCDVALALHRAERAIACHHCGHREPVPVRCDACGSPSVARYGAGTERLEAELIEALDVPVFRLDADSAARKDAVPSLLARFAASPAGLLVGTQMVAKGHDFPDVTLGVVVDADATLRFPDFRAEERTFALIAQLAGRAGRGPRGGRVLVQTTAPEAPAIAAAARHDTAGFVAGELERRRALEYPPFADLIRIVCSGPEAGRHAVRRPRSRRRRRPRPARRCSGRRRCSACAAGIARRSSSRRTTGRRRSGRCGPASSGPRPGASIAAWPSRSTSTRNRLDPAWPRSATKPTEVAAEDPPPRLDPETRARRDAALAHVRTHGDPVLRSRALPIDRFDAALRDEIGRMGRLMSDALGIGLAATQVGAMHRVLVYRVEAEAEIAALVNPVLEWASDDTEPRRRAASACPACSSTSTARSMCACALRTSTVSRSSSRRRGWRPA